MAVVVLMKEELLDIRTATAAGTIPVLTGTVLPEQEHVALRG